MPFLVIERFRDFGRDLGLNPFEWKVAPSDGKRKSFPIRDLAVEVTDMFANCVFVVGSICFLPRFEDDLNVFLSGCILFVIGAAIYLGTCSYCMVESYMHHRYFSFEVMENLLYIIGAWIFLVGTILYWPTAAHYPVIESMKDLALGQYFNLYTPEFEGTVLFAIGSAVFGFAAFTNALNHRNFEGKLGQLMTACTSISMAADMLFIAGSIAFLPDMGCGRGMIRLGAWMFIIGSAMFVLSSFLAVYRTMLKWRDSGKPMEPR